MVLFRRFLNLFRRSALQREIEDELQSHIELQIEANLAEGMSPEEARRSAYLRFGNRASTSERVASVDTGLAAESFIRNLRYALRQLRRSPAFAITAVLALALGIGPNVAIFSIVWATFFAPMPYPDADQMVVVWNHYKGERNPSNSEDYARYLAQSTSFQRLDFLSWLPLHLTNPDHTEDEVTGNALTPGFYTYNTRLHFSLGRDFLPEEGLPGKNHVVILTHRLWAERYRSDPNVIGKSILVEDHPYTIVGVLQPVPTDRNGTHFIVPVTYHPGVHSQDFGNVFGRLKPGVTLQQAQAELSVIDRTISRHAEAANDAANWSISVEQLKNDWLDKKVLRNIWMLLAAVGLVLLIACANVANLLLARGVSRKQELAVRSALGATRGQIFTQLLTESITLAVLGGALGVGLGWAIMKVAMSMFPDLVNQSTETVVEMNVPVLCFAIALSIVAGILFGCAPGWRAGRVDVNETLKLGSRSLPVRERVPIQSVLVAAEIALAMVLLAGAGMAIHSFWKLTHIDLGFSSERLITGRLRPHLNLRPSANGQVQYPSPESIVTQQQQVLERVRAVPGVLDASLTTTLPLTENSNFPFTIAGQAYDKVHPTTADFVAASPGYFNTLEIRMVRGRAISETDNLNSPLVVLVNETFVRRFLPNVDPLLQRLVMPRLGLVPNGAQSASEFQVVGIYHDALHGDRLVDDPGPQVLVSLTQAGWPFVSFAIRTAVDPAAVSSGIRRAISEAAPGTSIENLQIMQRMIEGKLSTDRFGMVLFGSFAAIALVLAALGIYGVMAFVVEQRTHEIGIRMALGARRGDVVALILKRGIRIALAGVSVGLVGALALERLMHSTLYGMQSVDLTSLSAVGAILLTVAIFACWIPARRSSGIDPMRALRSE
jgi:putative ABC transport system permease protein